MKLPALQIGKSPTGPLGKPTLTGGGYSRRGQFKTAASKKGHAGIMAGIGRHGSNASHPHGPGFARRNPVVTLPSRPSLAPRASSGQAKRGGVFGRVARRARGLFGF